MLADGTSAATGGNGDFGTSPIFGQLSDKPLLVLCTVLGVPNAKHNSGATILLLSGVTARLSIFSRRRIKASNFGGSGSWHTPNTSLSPAFIGRAHGLQRVVVPLIPMIHVR